MLQVGLICSSTNLRAAPLHMARKNEADFLPAGDFRRLNTVTIPDRYPLPKVQDFSSALFSEIDLVYACHPIPVNPMTYQR